MQVASVRKSRATLPRTQVREVVSNLDMYLDPPEEELTLEDFEVYAVDRLLVLKGIETARARGMAGIELYRKSEDLMQKHIGKPDDKDTQRKDRVSHHILRLAYCGTEEKRRWFLAQEVTLFRARLEKETPEQIAAFMRHNGLTFTKVTPEEKKEVEPMLRAVVDAAGPSNDGEPPVPFERISFFKVPFTQALDLVNGRKVYLRAGFAYVPQEKLTNLIVARFRAALSYSLVCAYKTLPAVLRDERISPMLLNLSKAYVGQQFGATQVKGDEVTADQVDGLAKESFPLCMRWLHMKLKESHHLRHAGRMQYGLFLKGIGLSLEQALLFWQAEFTKKMSPEEFLKKYAYNIRHNYGKEGKRADYTPYSCQRIIMGAGPGGPTEHHGCPYRHWDVNHLKSVLSSMQLSSSAVDDILSSVNSKDYQIACRKEFEARHQVADAGDVGNHPNTYFIESRALIGGANQQEGETSKQEVMEEGSRVTLSFQIC